MVKFANFNKTMISKKELFLRKHSHLYCFADNCNLCRKLLAGGVRVIQYRNKTVNHNDFYKIAKEMSLMIRSYQDAIYIINDNVDVAIKLKADGIHLGRTDESYIDVMKRTPEEMILGISVDNEQEAMNAENAGITYLGAGAVFPSQTKTDAPVIGITGLQKIVQSVKIPVVAIGGIKLNNLNEVMKTGVRHFGIISEINNSDDISAKLKEFYTIINRG